MQQVKELGAGEGRRYGVEWGEKQISFSACQPWRLWLRGEEGLDNSSGEVDREGERGGRKCKSEKTMEKVVRKEHGGKARVKICERETRRIQVMMTKDSMRGNQARARRAMDEQMTAKETEGERGLWWKSSGSAAQSLYKAPCPPFDLSLPFLLQIAFLVSYQWVQIATDTQCSQLSDSWQSVHHTLK